MFWKQILADKSKFILKIKKTIHRHYLNAKGSFKLLVFDHSMKNKMHVDSI